MADVMWLVRRLRAMSIPEVVWRTGQKITQKKEAVYFKPNKTEVVGKVFNPKLTDLRIDAEKMHLNLKNTTFSMSTVIPLLGGGGDMITVFINRSGTQDFRRHRYGRKDFLMNWNTNRETISATPEQTWELNRHFQFALLAKAYRVSENKKYLDELETLFYDWNKKNPFLWGISWTSVMEIAIRCSNCALHTAFWTE